MGGTAGRGVFHNLSKIISITLPKEVDFCDG